MPDPRDRAPDPQADPQADPEAEADSTAARLIGALVEGAELVDDGQFSLDTTAAAAKRERFAYADRSVHLVPLVEGLLRLGASAIELEGGRGRVDVLAHGVALERAAAQLRDLYVHQPHDANSPLRRLAVGLDVALGSASQARARIRYGEAQTNVLAQLRAQQAPIVSEPDDGDRAAPGLVQIELRGLAVGASEAFAALRLAVEHVPVPITIEGEQVSGYPRGWWETERGAGPGYRFAVGLVEQGAPDSVIELWTGGLCVERIPAPDRLFQAVLELDDPRWDLGQLTIVRDEAVERALAAVGEARTRLLERLADADARWTVRSRPPEWTPARVAMALGRPQPEAGGRDIVERPLTPLQLFWRLRGHDRVFGGGGVLHSVARIVVTLAALLALLPLGFGLFRLDLEGLGIALAVLVPALGLAGLLSLPVALGTARVLRARDHGVRTLARISTIERLAGTDPERITHARLHWQFVDRDGVGRTGQSARRQLDEAERWQIGEQIHVYYDPEAPEASWAEAEIGPRPGRNARA